jgi:hypothetical protein
MIRWEPIELENFIQLVNCGKSLPLESAEIERQQKAKKSHPVVSGWL